MTNRLYRIFLSSPGDVATERERAEAVVRALDAELSGVSLELVRWEDSVYSATATYQDQIIDPRECDLVVCLFWYRLGTPLPPQYNRSDGSSRSGTEYEFERAVGAECGNETDAEEETPDVLVYRKTAPLPDESDLTRSEYRAMESFWRRWFRDEEGHYLAAFDTFEDTDGFAERFERQLRQWLESQREAIWDVHLHGSPFRGLQAFDEQHARVFFGRRREVERARARLMAAAERGRSSLLIIGASGSGKSSLMRAGLLPRLLVPGSTAPLVHRWRRGVLSPAGLVPDVAGGLARALMDEEVLPGLAAVVRAQDLERDLAERPGDALGAIHRALDRQAEHLAASEGWGQAPRTGLLIAVDQLEELFSLDERQQEILLAILDVFSRDERIWLIASMRSDFYPRLHDDPRLMAFKQGGRVLDLPAPSAADIREMIEGAAHAAGLEFEDDGERSLVDLLESEVGQPGSLPMLQFALQALFEARDPEQGLLRLADYDRMGGAAGALASEAEQVVARSGDEAAFDRVLWRLAAVSAESGEDAPQARIVSLEEFPAESPERAIVDGLLEARLLVTWSASDTDERYLRVAHESLFRNWPRAAERLGRLRRDLETRERLEHSRQLWLASPESERPQRLLRGLGLEEARDLDTRWEEALPRELHDYIQASLQASHRRRQRRVAVVSGVMLVLAGLAGSATWFGFSAEQARERAEQAQKETEQARADAEQVISLQQELLDEVDPGGMAGGMVARWREAAADTGLESETLETLLEASSPVDDVREILVQQVLEPARGRLDIVLADTPALQARLQQTLAEIYRHWGDREPAVELAGEAHKTLSRERGPQDPQTLRAGKSMAAALRSSGDFEAAEEQASKMLERSRSAHGADHEVSLALAQELGLIHHLMGDLEGALELESRVHERRQELLGEAHPDTLDIASNLVVTLREKQRLDDARDLTEASLRLAQADLGEDHMTTLRLQHNLGLTLFDQGEFQEAHQIMEDQLNLYREIQGRRHPTTLTVMNHLAATLRELGEYDQALDLEERVINKRREVMSETHPFTLVAERNLGETLLATGRYADARDRLERVYRTQRESMSADHPDLLETRVHLGRALSGLGEPAAAEEHLDAALTGLSEIHGPRHVETTVAADAGYRHHRDQGNETRARQLRDDYLAWLLDAAEEELLFEQRRIRDRLQ